jgi:tripartite-type tricarboxylate transporter receptor subunit TctC
VTGAGATIAGSKVARAAPDGYNIILGNWTSHVGGGAIYSLNYHVMNDFEPIALLPASYLWIVGRSDLPANNTKELVAWLKANPGKGTAATVGVGSAAQMCLVDFANKSGTTFQYIPYRGGAPAVRDLLGKQVDFGCLEVSQTLPHVAAGNLKPFGVVAKKRSPAAPNVPTLGEGGVPNVELIFWQAMWAPKGTPRPIIDTLNAAVRKALADPEVRARFVKLGQDIPSNDELTPEALAKHHKAELDKWWPVMKAAGIKAPQ